MDIEILVLNQQPTKSILKLDNMAVLEELRALRDKVYRDPSAAFTKVYDYIATLEEQYRNLKISNTEFANMLAESDPELKAVLESRNK